MTVKPLKGDRQGAPVDCRGHDGFDCLDGNLERTQHDIAGAYRLGGRRSDRTVRAGRDRDRVLTLRVDGDECDPGGNGGRPELGTVDAARLQIGAHPVAVLVHAPGWLRELGLPARLVDDQRRVHTVNGWPADPATAA